MSRAIAESKWRNFRPFAPDIFVEARKGVGTNIDLRDYLVQGAKNWSTNLPQQEILDRLGAQRGAACTFFNISKPKKGRVTHNLYQTGFLYTSSPWYTGQDCFSYCLNNGSQTSEPGRVIINVLDYGEVRIFIEEDTGRRTRNKRFLRFIVQWSDNIDLSDYDIVHVTWYMHRPTVFVDQGVTYVRNNKETVASTEVTQDVLRAEGFTITQNNYRFPVDGSFFAFEWPQTRLRNARDAVTGQRYQQPNGPWPVSVDVSFRKTSYTEETVQLSRWRYVKRFYANWGAQETLSADVRTLYGDDWWQTGNVRDINQPNFVPVEPGVLATQ